MLILSRKPNQSIMIGYDIRVVLLQVKHNTVRLGIDAPKSIGVHRNEIYQQIQASLQASQPSCMVREFVARESFPAKIIASLSDFS